MALQGTLDTFALPDVLRLLAATQKTGRLRLTGPRGTGSISVDSGTIGAIEASAAPLAVEPVDALFELLRFEQGSFTFDADCAPAAESGPGVGDLEALLAEAEAMLAEWLEIGTVVPSMDAWVTLRPSLRTAKVSLDRDHWHTIVAIGGGATVRQIADALSLPELPASRSVRALVELGLSDVVTEPPPGLVPARALRRSEPLVAAAEPFSRAEPERFVPLDLPSRGPVPVEGATSKSVAPEPGVEPQSAGDLFAAFPGLGGSTVEHPARTADAGQASSDTAEVVDDAHDADDADEVARQLARLSPRAADAVRNAAVEITDEARAAALANTGNDDDEPINRGLLLKFLSSVKD